MPPPLRSPHVAPYPCPPLALVLAGLVAAAGLVTVATPSPAVAALDSPSALTASEATNPVLSWERVPGATGYDLELSRTADFTTASRLGTVVSTVNDHYVPPAQLPTDLVWWRVRGKNSGELGEYTIGSFTPLATDAPVMVQPPAEHEYTAPTAPRFTWEPVAGATSYTVQTGRDPQFTDPTGSARTGRSRRRPTSRPIRRPGRYFWRVRAELTTGYCVGLVGVASLRGQGPAGRRAGLARGQLRPEGARHRPGLGARCAAPRPTSSRSAPTTTFGAATMELSESGIVSTQLLAAPDPQQRRVLLAGPAGRRQRQRGPVARPAATGTPWKFRRGLAGPADPGLPPAHRRPTPPVLLPVDRHRAGQQVHGLPVRQHRAADLHHHHGAHHRRRRVRAPPRRASYRWKVLGDATPPAASSPTSSPRPPPCSPTSRRPPSPRPLRAPSTTAR